MGPLLVQTPSGHWKASKTIYRIRILSAAHQQVHCVTSNSRSLQSQQSAGLWPSKDTLTRAGGWKITSCYVGTLADPAVTPGRGRPGCVYSQVVPLTEFMSTLHSRAQAAEVASADARLHPDSCFWRKTETMTDKRFGPHCRLWHRWATAHCVCRPLLWARGHGPYGSASHSARSAVAELIC